MTNSLELTQRLLRVPSVSGSADNSCIDYLEELLGKLGFTSHRLFFDDKGSYGVDNLYASIGSGGPHLCFAGHTDVVPAGNGWTVEPFSGELISGRVFGRGAVDMKSAIGCFVEAVDRFLKSHPFENGTISLLITGDEEKEAVNGTVRVLQWMAQNGHKPDACIVGEPTSEQKVGDTYKIGRRGSLSAEISTNGVQGHVAYPAQAQNPIPSLLRILNTLQNRVLDEGCDGFAPSNLEIATIDVGNTSRNTIPARANATINIRFNPTHTNQGLRDWISDTVHAEPGADVRFFGNGDAFINPSESLSRQVVEAIKSTVGLDPVASTGGGTSDARFIKDTCPTIELGVMNALAHKVDEHVAVADLEALSAIYLKFIEHYFAD